MLRHVGAFHQPDRQRGVAVRPAAEHVQAGQRQALPDQVDGQDVRQTAQDIDIPAARQPQQPEPGHQPAGQEDADDQADHAGQHGQQQRVEQPLPQQRRQRAEDQRQVEERVE
jgi:hypothetical protein